EKRHISSSARVVEAPEMVQATILETAASSRQTHNQKRTSSMTASDWKWFYAGSWGTILFFTLIFAVSMYVIVAVPGKWDNAVVLRKCDGGNTIVIRRRDGTIWARFNSWHRAYLVEDEKAVCP